MTKKHLFPIFFLSVGVLSIIAAAIVIAASGRSKTTTNQIARFSSCSELATWLNNSTKQLSAPYYKGTAEISKDATASGSNYSPTNVQLAGIDEADGVKTDGKYIYTIRNEKVYVASVDTNSPQIVKVLEPSINPISLYVTDKELIVLGTNFGSYGKYALTDDTLSSRSSILPTKSNTYAFTYDKSNWSLRTTLGIEGSVKSSRLLNGKLYLALTAWNYSLGSYDAARANDFLPKYELGGNSDSKADLNATIASAELTEQLTSCDKLAYLGQEGTNLVSVVEFDLANQSIRSEVAVGGASNLYMSYNNLYLFNGQYKNVRRDVRQAPVPCDPISSLSGGCPISVAPEALVFDFTTGIYKLSLADMQLVAAGEVDGNLLNQYSVDERNDHLRVVTTSMMSGSELLITSANVFVLDKDLKEVGKLTDLAPGERVYSARFLSERLYIVTFKQVDPLFVIDLSSPSSPKVLGELKVTGYSDYLHNIGENKVLGFGKEVDPRTGRLKELKISAFDATNPTKPIELSKLSLDLGVDSTVLSNPKALYIEADRKRLAMPLYEYTIAGKTIYAFGVFEFDGNKLTQLATIDTRDNVENNYYDSADDLRIIRVGERFVAMGQNTIAVYDYAKLNKLGELVLETTAKKTAPKLLID